MAILTKRVMEALEETAVSGQSTLRTFTAQKRAGKETHTEHRDRARLAAKSIDQLIQAAREQREMVQLAFEISKSRAQGAFAAVADELGVLPEKRVNGNGQKKLKG